MTGLTDAQTRALRVLDEQCDGDPDGTTTPREVARALWPDSKAWTVPTHRRGAGGGGAGVYGGTMPMKAATVLHRLRERGLAEHDPRGTGSNQWRITDLGERVLAGTAEPRPAPPRHVPTAGRLIRKPKPRST